MAAVSWSSRRLDLFVRDVDGQLGHRGFYGNGWTP